jgi:enoyl-CoA hydratase/carnithine racemase
MCDLGIASEDSRFATSGINYGLFCSTPAVGISRAMHPKQAFEMLVTGDFINADEAVRRGLINKAVNKKDLDDHILQLSLKIANQVSNVVYLMLDMSVK